MKKWVVAEEERNVSLFPYVFAWYGWTREIGRFAGKALSEGLFEFDAGRLRIAWHQEEFEAVGEALYGRIADEKFYARVLRRIYADSEAMLSFCREKLDAKNLRSKTDASLLESYFAYGRKLTAVYGAGLVPPALDYGHGRFSRMLSDYLKQRIAEASLNLNAAEAFSVLTTSPRDSFLQQMEKDFLKGVALVQAGKIEKRVEAARLAGKWDWLSFHFQGPVEWDEAYFEGLIESESRQGDARKKLAALVARKKEVMSKQKKYLRQLDPDKHHLHLLTAARELLYAKTYRRDVATRAFHYGDRLNREIARRLNLSPAQARFILPEEMRAALVERRPSSTKELNERLRFSVTITDSRKTVVFTGKKARKISGSIISPATPASKLVTSLEGDCACPGRAIGTVKLVLEPKDIPKMRKGDVLVSAQTNPNLVPAMKLAGAIVTDGGGITCHAAIVSRELQTPCVIGTKIATKWLKDGDLVEVDATKGIVCKVKVKV